MQQLEASAAAAQALKIYPSLVRMNLRTKSVWLEEKTRRITTLPRGVHHAIVTCRICILSLVSGTRPAHAANKYEFGDISR
jgi:hypothetical protein